MRLTANFDLTEFVVSQEATRRKIDNTPTPEIVGRLKKTAELLEEVRAVLRKPILISSGYRCATLNKSVGGVWNSAHVSGQAADFQCPGFGSPVAVWAAIRDSGIKFDQLINEYGAWVHIAWAEGNRQQAFAIT